MQQLWTKIGRTTTVEKTFYPLCFWILSVHQLRQQHNHEERQHHHQNLKKRTKNLIIFPPKGFEEKQNIQINRLADLTSRTRASFGYHTRIHAYLWSAVREGGRSEDPTEHQSDQKTSATLQWNVCADSSVVAAAGRGGGVDAKSFKLSRPYTHNSTPVKWFED